jgi:Kef-type K+ transport system membrane component KefB
MHILYYFSIILFAGLIVARILSKVKLPNVTGYLIAGILIGPSIMKLIPKDAASSLSIISEIALGFIAYGIGSEFNIRHIKKMGKSIIWITIFEALGAVVLVDIFMIFVFKQSVPFSLMLGAIAAATAPAATIMVIRQYKAKGPVVNTLLPVVAIDDAVGIIAFGISSAIAKMLMNPNKDFSVAKAILIPIWEIIFALIIGFVIGILLAYISSKAKGEDELLVITIASILLALGLAKHFNVSTLLACMMLGATIANMAQNSNRLLSIVDRVTPPIFVAFFTLAGVDLDLGVLKDVGLIGIGYVFVRVIGKFFGAYLGAYITNAPKTVQKYLGFTLMPQAGVAIGLSMIAEQSVPGHGAAIRTIILAGTVIYELVGPVTTKLALIKAGEIQTAE